MPFGILKENECEKWKKKGMDRKIEKQRNRGKLKLEV